MPVAVEGLRQKVSALVALGTDVEDLKDGFAAIAAEGAQIAGRLAPRVTDKLAGTVRGNRAKSTAIVTAGRASVPYAGPINYGWPRRTIAASLFLQRADAQLEDRAPAILEDQINQAITRRGLA